jgi:hypothetical protein
MAIQAASTGTITSFPVIQDTADLHNKNRPNCGDYDHWTYSFSFSNTTAMAPGIYDLILTQMEIGSGCEQRAA